MAIKFGMTVADMIMQLTKGFMKATGRKPEALEKIKIQQEAAQRFKEMNKVVDMEGKTIDTSKGIMGGKQAKAMGGRIGFGGGSDMGTVADSQGNVGPGKGGYQGAGDGKGGKAGGEGDGPDDRGTAQQNMVQSMVKAGMTPSQIRNATRGKGFNLGKSILGNLVTGGAYSLLDPNVRRAISAVRGLGSLKDIYGGPTGNLQSQFGFGNLFGDDDDEEESGSKKDDLQGMAETVRNMDKVMDRQAQIEARAKELGFADGGRIGYKLGSLDKARRAFLKKAAGIGGGIAALKTGLLGLSKKAPETIETVKETVKQAPDYFFALVDKIRRLGTMVDDAVADPRMEKTYRYKNYELRENAYGTPDETVVTKIDDRGEFGYKEESMIYKKGGMTEEGRVADEYEEFTVRPDEDGKLKDIDTGIDDVSDIIREATDQAPSIKKAGGGIARMLGE